MKGGVGGPGESPKLCVCVANVGRAPQAQGDQRAWPLSSVHPSNRYTTDSRGMPFMKPLRSLGMHYLLCTFKPP